MTSSRSEGSAVVISRGASYLTIQTVVTTVVQALCFAILTRIITPTDVGILAVISLITNLAQAINGGAFQQATMKFVGQYAGSNGGLAAGVFYQTLLVSLVLSTPISGFIFLESRLLAQWLLGATEQTIAGYARFFQVLAIDDLVYSGMLPVAIGAVYGTRRFKAAAAVGTAGVVLKQVLTIFLILLLKDFVGMIYAWFLSDIATLAGYGFFAVRTLGLTRNTFPVGRLLSFSWPLTIGNLVGYAYLSFDRAILVGSVPLSSLGVYNAVLYAYGALTSIGASFTTTLLPVYSSISGELQRCRRAIWRASRYVSLVMVPLALGLFATAKPALTIFVGVAYLEGAVPLMILSLPYALTAFSLALSPMLTALGKTRAVMWITISSLMLALASAYVLLPFMGISGAAVARGVAAFASLGLTIYVLSQVDIVQLDVEMIWKTLLAGGVMASVLLAIESVFYSAILLPAYVLVGALVYLILLRLLNAVRKHDIELIERYLGSRLGFVARILSAILLK